MSSTRARLRRLGRWLCAALPLAGCGDAPGSATLSRHEGGVREVARYAGEPTQLAVARGADGAWLGAIGESGLTVWRSSSDLSQWSEVVRVPEATVGDVAPAAAPVRFVAGVGGTVHAGFADGTMRPFPIASAPTVSILELRVTGGLAAGVTALVQQRRPGQAALNTVWFSAFENGALSPWSELSQFESMPRQAALDSCASPDSAVIVLAWNALAGRAGAAGDVVSFQTLRFDRISSTWIADAAVDSSGAGPRFEGTVILSPGGLSVRCERDQQDVLVRSGAVWRTRHSGGWEPPQRVIPFSAGYASRGRTIDVCADGTVVWIDDRLERGADGGPFSGGGFPWSDSYPGWRITSVHSSRFDGETRGAPKLLSSDVGRQVAVAASSGGGCLVAWAGSRRVEKAGGSADDLATRLYVAALD